MHNDNETDEYQRGGQDSGGATIHGDEICQVRRGAEIYILNPGASSV
jgi:hypothetical protein